MAELRIYHDIILGQPAETVRIPDGHSLGDYLRSIPGHDPDIAPFDVERNGVAWPREMWDMPLQGDDVLSLRILPSGPGAIPIVALVISAVSVAYAIYAYTQIPDPQRPQDLPDASSLLNPNAQGNKVRLGGVIPENFGRFPSFPDLLNFPRREYIDHEQYLYLMLCVGVGKYEIDPDDIQIGNTPITRYEDDIDYQIFGPGVDVSGHPAHRCFYQSIEVGSGSGRGGFELSAPVSVVGSTEPGASFHFWYMTSDSIYLKYHNPLNGQTFVSDFPASVTELFQWNAAEGGSTLNEGVYRVESINNEVATVVKMLPDLTAPDPLWTSFVTEEHVKGEMVRLSETGEGANIGPYLATPPGLLSDRFQLDFVFARGLGELDDGGNFLERSIEIQIEYRDADLGGSWEVEQVEFTGETNSERAFTHEVIAAAPLRAEFRVRRLTSTEDSAKVFDEVQWSALRAEIAPATSYPGLTTIAMRIKGSNNLASAAENKVTVLGTRQLPIYDANTDTWSAETSTRQIAPVAAYVAKSVGYSDSTVDLLGLDELQALWDARSDHFDHSFDSPMVFWDVMKTIFAVGYALPLQDFGKITARRDAERTLVEEQYTPDSISPQGVQRDWTLIDPDEPDGIEVEYFDVATRKPVTVMATLPGESGLRAKKLQVPGIVDRTRAWRKGMRERRRLRYQRKRFEWSTGLDGLNSTPMSFCSLTDDQMDQAITGLVTACSSDRRTLTLNQPIAFDGAGPHYIAVRKPNGTQSPAIVVTAGVTDHEVELASPLPWFPVLDGSQEPPHFAFGAGSSWQELVLITDVRPTDTGARLTAVKYDERIYADDNNSPP